MWRFDGQIRVDKTRMRFYASCSACGKRRYAGRLPPLCRRKKLVDDAERGQADSVRQTIFNRSRRAAARRLAVCFNLCRACGSWVCDDCFVYDRSDGLCRRCCGNTETED